MGLLTAVVLDELGEITLCGCGRWPADAAGLRFSVVLGGGDMWSGGQWDGRDAGEDGDDVVDPGPGGGDAQVPPAAAVGQPCRYV